MPTALNYGYFKPDTGENGTIFGPTIEDNWERIADHRHDGSDSVQLNSEDLAKDTSKTAPSGSWVADGARYKQNVTFPTGFTYEDTNIVVMNNATKERMVTTIKKVDSDTFTVYCNDNTLTLAFTLS